MTAVSDPKLRVKDENTKLLWILPFGVALSAPPRRPERRKAFGEALLWKPEQVVARNVAADSDGRTAKNSRDCITTQCSVFSIQALAKIEVVVVVVRGQKCC